MDAPRPLSAPRSHPRRPSRVAVPRKPAPALRGRFLFLGDRALAENGAPGGGPGVSTQRGFATSWASSLGMHKSMMTYLPNCSARGMPNRERTGTDVFTRACELHVSACFVSVGQVSQYKPKHPNPARPRHPKLVPNHRWRKIRARLSVRAFGHALSQPTRGGSRVEPPAGIEPATC